MTNNFFEINNLLYKQIKENKAFSLLRIDNTTGYIIDSLFKGSPIDSRFFNPLTLIEAGVVPNDVKYAIEVVYAKTIQAMCDCDILGFVDVSEEIKNRGNFWLEKLGKKPIFFTGHSYHVLDPCCLLKGEIFGKPEIIWTEALKDKKVLVISPHYETIIQQWEKIDLIWGEDRKKIVPFNLAGVIRAPHHPALDDRQYPNCNTWEETVEYTKNEITKYDYDVLLTAVSHQSPFYANFAKESGKIGIQTGGILQLFFGIKGGRWTQQEVYKPWKDMMNEHWIYPLPNDRPQRLQYFSFLETNSAYWS